MTVKLTEDQALTADAIGEARTRESVARGAGNGHGEARGNLSFEDRLKHDRMSARAEMAFAMAMGIPYTPVMDWQNVEGDVLDFEVRSTHHASGRLIVFEKDKDELKYVLVIVDGLYCHIVGWIYGFHAKCDEYLNKGFGVRTGSPRQWWVPQSALTPLPAMAV